MCTNRMPVHSGDADVKKGSNNPVKTLQDTRSFLRANDGGSENMLEMDAETAEVAETVQSVWG